MSNPIRLDPAGIPEQPTFVLATRSARKLGVLRWTSAWQYHAVFNGADEIFFDIYKYDPTDDIRTTGVVGSALTDQETAGGSVVNPLWGDVLDYRLVWYPEIDKWFQIAVSLDEGDETVKHVTGTAICESELSQTNVYDLEINTEDDIARDDYVVTVFYDPENADGSLLDRVLYKFPHYTIGHVDASLRHVQRPFSWSDTSTYDALMDIAEEVGCLLVFDSGTDTTGEIARTVNAYDLQSYCTTCGKRFEGHYDVCPYCGSSNITEPYGEESGIIISKENLSNDISLTSDQDATKNCFRLVAGDDVMTAAVRFATPDGSGYIWHISDEMKEDMSDALVQKLNAYDTLYSSYYKRHNYTVDSTAYNALTAQYDPSFETYHQILSGGSSGAADEDAIVLSNYPKLTEAFYTANDFYYYLHDSMMPSYTITVYDIEQQAARLADGLADGVALMGITSSTSSATVETAIKSLARQYVDTGLYNLTITTTSWVSGENAGTWDGSVTLTDRTDSTVTASTGALTVAFTSDPEDYTNQLLQIKISAVGNQTYDISGLFAMDLEDFQTAIETYSLAALQSFYACCETCLDVLIEQGCGNPDGTTIGGVVWTDAYTDIYQPWYQKLTALRDEIDTRAAEIDTVQIMLDGLTEHITSTHDALDFEGFVGTALWEEFISYRREDTYSNTNFISDGLSNAEIIEYARQFIEQASVELYKSSVLQHSISSSLHNLLIMPEFAGLVNHFDVGVWIRILVDEKPYRLRLLEYTIDWDNNETIDVRFSDVDQWSDGFSDVRSVLQSAKSMTTSYKATVRNAERGAAASTWFDDGVNASLMKIINNAHDESMTFDANGLKLMQYDELKNTYSAEQLKILHNILAFTDDDWRTVKVAIGKVIIDGEEKYGILAENIYGKFGQFVELNADTLTAGTITDVNGVNYWDLDTGVLHLSTGVVIGGAGSTTTLANTLVDSYVEYAVGASSSTAPTTGWSESSPTWTSGSYIWQRTAYVYAGSSTPEYSDPVCIQGATGQSGNGISSVTVTYGTSSSPSTQPSSWSNTAPSSIDAGDYLWTRTVIDYTDPNMEDTVSYTYSRQGENGQNGSPGTSVTVSSIEYQAGTSATTPPAGTWSSSVVSVDAGKYLWTKTTFSDGTVAYGVARQGENGIAATAYSLIVSNAAVAKSQSGTYNPTSITLTSKAQVGSSAMTNYAGRFEIETTTDNSSWTSRYTSSSNQSSYTYTIPSNIIAIRCSLYLAGGTSTLLDQQIVPIVTDGANGSSVIISSIQYAAGTSGTTPPASGWQNSVPTVAQGGWLWVKTMYSDNSTATTCSYMGTDGDDGTSVAVTSATKSGGVTTVVLTDTDGNTTTLTINDGEDGDNGTPGASGYVHTAWANSADGSVDFSTSVSTDKKYLGVYTDHTQADSQSYGAYSWSLIKGNDGADAYTVILTNESHTFAGSTSAAIAGSTTCGVIAYKGATQVAATIGTISGQPTGMSTSLSNNGTTSASFTVTVTTSMTTKNGTLSVPVTVDGHTFTKQFTYSLALTGATGATGLTGNGIDHVTEYYATSTTTTAPAASAYSTTAPTLTATNKYLWNYEEITYTNTSTTTTDPCMIGVYGDKGVGIDHITEYYLATSDATGVTTSTDGWTNSVQSVTMVNKYLWNYEVVTYTDSSTFPTTPCIIGVYGDSGTLYGTSSTPAATATKVVSCSNFALIAGTTVSVKFSNANTSSGAVKLNINSTGAKNVYVASTVTSASNQLLWGANAYITFMYDGAQFIVIGEPRAWCGACNTSAATAEKTDTTAIPGCVICNGAQINLTMTNNNTSTNAAQLNICGTGGKNIYYGTTTTSPTVANGHSWIADTTVTFTFDGQYYRMQGQTMIDGDRIITGTVAANKLDASIITSINNANLREQTIYRRAAAGTTTVATPADWVTDSYTTNVVGFGQIETLQTVDTSAATVWTTRRPEYSVDYPLTFVAIQRETTDGTITCTTPIVDGTTTVIDGSHILTGTIDASLVNVVNLNADNIVSGMISTHHLDVGDIISHGAIVVTSDLDDAIDAMSDNAASDVSTHEEYYLSTSSTSATGSSSGWQTSMPTWESNKYVWKRIATTVTSVSGSPTTTYKPSEDGEYDKNLTTALSTAASAQTTANSAVGSASVKTQYYLSSSSLSATGGSWQDTIPSWSSGKYIWTRVATTTTPVSGLASTTYQPSENGVYDANLTTALSTAASAASAASTAQTTVNGANARTQRIYYRKTALGAPTAPLTWIDIDANQYGAWTRKIPPLTNGTTKYPYLYTCVQSQTVAQQAADPQTVTNSAVLLDDTTTVIDGGNIITGTVTANQIDTSTLTVSSMSDANTIIKEEQLIYCAAGAVTTSVNATTDWVTNDNTADVVDFGKVDTLKVKTQADISSAWSIRRPEYSPAYPVTFVAIQRKLANGTVTCTTPVVDGTTTIIDGGHIVTGTIDASMVNVVNLNASNITTGTLDASLIRAGSIDAKLITTGTLSAIDISGVNIEGSTIKSVYTDIGAYGDDEEIEMVYTCMIDQGHLTSSLINRYERTTSLNTYRDVTLWAGGLTWYYGNSKDTALPMADAYASASQLVLSTMPNYNFLLSSGQALRLSASSVILMESNTTFSNGVTVDFTNATVTGLSSVARFG